MRADRLLAILMLLQSKGRMTAHDLANQLEVSERTIYRDLEALGIAGIPVYTERGPGGGCELLDGYQTRLTGLTTTEVRALFLSYLTEPLAALGLGKALESAFLKLSAALPANSRIDVDRARQRFHIDTSWWQQDAEPAAVLPTLQDAIWHDRKLCLVYSDSSGRLHECPVEPYGLVSRATRWYLIARRSPEVRAEHDIYDIQVYPISHIRHAILLDEQFIHPEHFDLARFWTTYWNCYENEESIPPVQIIKKALRPPLAHWERSLTEEKKRGISVQGQSQRKKTSIKKTHIKSTPGLMPIKKTASFSDASHTQEKKEGFLNQTSTYHHPSKKSNSPQEKKRFHFHIKKRNLAPIFSLHCA